MRLLRYSSASAGELINKNTRVYIEILNTAVNVLLKNIKLKFRLEGKLCRSVREISDKAKTLKILCFSKIKIKRDRSRLTRKLISFTLVRISCDSKHRKIDPELKKGGT